MRDSSLGVHWTPLSRERTTVVLTCVARVLRDSNRTLDVLTVEEITGQAQLAHLLERGTFESDEGRALLRDRPHLADLSIESLRALPARSLGREWAEFIDRHGLDLTLTRQPTPYTDDERSAYVLHRIRQSHDLWHVLLGVGTRGHEEVLVHSFSLAQTGLPASVAIVVLGALKHMVLEKRWVTLRRDLLGAHRRGRRAKPLVAAYWERYLDRPLDEVRARFAIEPMPAS